MKDPAEILFESKIVEIIEILNPDMDYDQFVKLKNKVFDKIMKNNFSNLAVQKINAVARNMSIIAVNLIGGLDVEDIEMEKW
jgi:hypothetical protein